MPPSSDPLRPDGVRPSIRDAEIVPERTAEAGPAGAASPGMTASGTTASGTTASGAPAFTAEAQGARSSPPPGGYAAGGPRFGAGGVEDASAARTGRLGTTLGGLALLGTVLVAGGLAYEWTHPPVPAGMAEESARVQALDGQLQAAKQQRDGLSAELDKLQARLATVEGRPQPNLAPIEQRLANLEKPAPVASTDISELARRLDSIAGRQDQLAARQQADVNTLSGRTDAAAAQVAAAGTAAVAALGKQLDAAQATLGKQLDAAEASDKAARDALSGRIDAAQAADKQARDTLAQNLGGRIDAAVAQAGAAGTAASTALGGRIDALAAADKGARDTLAAALGKRVDDAQAQDRQALDALAGKVGALDGRLGTVEQSSGKVAGLAARAGTMARLQSAQDNLAAGHKLGPIPGAPPALARYADVAPPTEASLRLSFADAAEAARQASQPQNANRPFLGRMWSRVQQAVVVRQGDDVLVGDPAAGVLARAQDAMSAGDLAGTVQIVETLQGPAREAMASWLAEAHQLLDARAALSSLVAHS